MLARLAAVTAITLLAACTPAPVVDLQILLCPPNRITKPECVKPPAPGTKRDQGDVFANELGCWGRVTAQDAAIAVCKEEMP